MAVGQETSLWKILENQKLIAPAASIYSIPPTHSPKLPKPTTSDNVEPPSGVPQCATGAARGPRRPARLWVHIYLHMQAQDFDLVPMLIGRGGCNMRKIADKTAAKVRIRGRGSGHLEIDGKQEGDRFCG